MDRANSEAEFSPFSDAENRCLADTARQSKSASDFEPILASKIVPGGNHGA